MIRNLEITDFKQIEEIIQKTQVCHLAMIDENIPYVVPMNFGYKDNFIYLHSGQAGRKIDILKNKNNQVCISMETGSELYVRHEQVACSYSMNFESVIINGKVQFVEDLDEKKEALSIIMSHYTPKKDFSFGIPALKEVVVMKIKIEKIQARRRGAIK